MKKILCFVAVIALMTSASAQQVSDKTGSTKDKSSSSKKSTGWKTGGELSLSLNQVGNSNWNTAGSDKFTLTSFANLHLFANKTHGTKFWNNSLDVVYGLTNTTANGITKVNDRIDFVSKLGYQTKKHKNISRVILGEMRSQLTDGYEYNYFGTTEKRRNSGFFAPAYVFVAPGLEYKACKEFSVFGSLTAFRATIVSNGPYSFASQGGWFKGVFQEVPLAALYNVKPSEQHLLQFGAMVSASMHANVLKNLTYCGRLDLYSNYIRRRSALVGFGFNSNVDLFMTNQFKLALNKWLQVSYNVDLQYDDDLRNPKSPTSAMGLQVLSTLGIGVNARF